MLIQNTAPHGERGERDFVEEFFSCPIVFSSPNSCSISNIFFTFAIPFGTKDAERTENTEKNDIEE